MDKLNQRKKLVDEVITLIREFEGIAVDIRETRIKELSIADDYSKISYELDGEKIIFGLDQISKLYQAEFEGVNGLEPTFIELVEAIKQDVRYNFPKMQKEDFIHYVGNIYYADFRGKEIYDRLREIDEEAKSIC